MKWKIKLLIALFKDENDVYYGIVFLNAFSIIIVYIIVHIINVVIMTINIT